MARPVTTLVVFFVCFNLFAGILLSTGAAAAVGIDADVGEDEAVNSQVERGENVSSGSPGGSTLFGLYNTLANQAGNFFTTVFPGLRMLERAGVSGFLTTGLLGPLFSVMIFIDVVSFLRGWGL